MYLTNVSPLLLLLQDTNSLLQQKLEHTSTDLSQRLHQAQDVRTTIVYSPFYSLQAARMSSAAALCRKIIKERNISAF